MFDGFESMQIGIQVHQAHIDHAHDFLPMWMIENIAGDTSFIGSPIANIREKPKKKRGKLAAGQLRNLLEQSNFFGKELKTPTELGNSQLLGELGIVRILGSEGLQ